MEKNAFVVENYAVKTVNDTVTQVEFLLLPPTPPLNGLEISADFFFLLTYFLLNCI